MSTYPARLALAAILAAIPTLVAVEALSQSPASAAEWCVNNGATYVAGKQVVPAGKYCVPGP